jgi:two-component system, chemotaxis family, response regulator WspF
MRIAIVNDLALAREVLRRVVLSNPAHSIAWSAVDGEEAVSAAARDRPDAILMDLVMPKLDGAEATRRIMKASPCPIIVVTATVPGNFDLVYRAMGAGALDAVETPTFGPGGVVQNGEKLAERLAKLDLALRGGHHAEPLTGSGPTSISVQLPRIVSIGVSTGGPAALPIVLEALPRDFPAAVLIAQHLDAEYIPGLAERLRAHCRLPVRTAKAGDVPQPGTVYLAHTNDHMELSARLRLHYNPLPKDEPYRPSVDALFSSLAMHSPRPGVAVLLTGMGTDGAEGLLRLRMLGWHTIAQDESTSVVYGMPRAAVQLGAAVEVLPLPLIGPAIVSGLHARCHPHSPGTGES